MISSGIGGFEPTGVRTINQSIRDAKRNRSAQHDDAPRLIAIPGSWRKKAERTANLLESFFHAFRGFWHAFTTERNLRIHVCMAVVVAASAFALKIDVVGWAMLTLATGIVITAELINTALERLVDVAANNEFHRLARDAKDTAAAAVLCSAIMATIIGGLVFVPRIMVLLVR